MVLNNKKNIVIIFYIIILMLSISNLLELRKINLMGKDESIRELFKTKYEKLWESNEGIDYYFDYETGNAYVIADDNNPIIILRIKDSLAAKNNPDLYPQETKRRDEKIGINTEIEGRDFNIVFKEGYIYAQTSRISVKPLKYVIYPDKVIKLVEGEKEKPDTEDKEILLMLKNRIETFNYLLSQVKKIANSIIIIKLLTLILFFIMLRKRSISIRNMERMLE